MRVNKTSEAFDSARDEYITGYDDEDRRVFPTLALVAKEFEISLSTLRKKAANEGWYKKRKTFQHSREEFVIRKKFKGKYSKLAQVSRNTLVFVEHFQTEINKELERSQKGEIKHSIENLMRLINCAQKVQRLTQDAYNTLDNLENPLLTFEE